jgi:hypothetical protein
MAVLHRVPDPRTTSTQEERDRLRGDDEPLDPMAMLEELSELQNRLEKLGRGEARDKVLARMRTLIATFEEACTPPSREEAEKLDALRCRADAIERLAPQLGPLGPRMNERVDAYRARLLNRLADFSGVGTGMRFFRHDGGLAAQMIEPIIGGAERRARADAAEGDRLIPVVDHDESGRAITRFEGNNLNWMQQFMSGATRCRIPDPTKGGN